MKFKKDVFMNYEIKIKNAPESNGTIDLQRLAAIADGIRKISEGALQIRLKAGFTLHFVIIARSVSFFLSKCSNEYIYL